VAVVAYGVLLGIHDGDVAPLGWAMAGVCAVGGLMLPYRLRTMEAWLVGPDLLLVGDGRRSDWTWRREPDRAIGLRVELSEDDGLRFDRFVAVVAPRGGMSSSART